MDVPLSLLQGSFKEKITANEWTSKIGGSCFCGIWVYIKLEYTWFYNGRWLPLFSWLLHQRGPIQYSMFDKEVERPRAHPVKQLLVAWFLFVHCFRGIPWYDLPQREAPTVLGGAKLLKSRPPPMKEKTVERKMGSLNDLPIFTGDFPSDQQLQQCFFSFFSQVKATSMSSKPLQWSCRSLD